MVGSGAEYLAFCRGENEVNYRRLYPNSLINDLLTDRPPLWLERVRMRPGRSIIVYQICSSRF